MLKEIYMVVGGVGAFFITVAMFFSFIGWWMAVTAVVTRNLAIGLKALLIVIISLFPPLGLLLVTLFVYLDRRAVSEAISSMSEERPLGSALNGARQLSSAQRVA
ncbi:MAG: hypothetical protein O2797_06395 [Bacteroidetes bacterium]|nr:hypothetical protein [Bacteroidota bacterium]MDA1333830.1 hypothetical protein [Bacteroidota bacterium]